MEALIIIGGCLALAFVLSAIEKLRVMKKMKVNIPDDFFEISLNTGGAFNTIGRARYQMDRNGSLFKTSAINRNVLDMPLQEFDEYVKTQNIFPTTFQVSKKTALPALGGNISMGKNLSSKARLRPSWVIAKSAVL